MSLSEWIDMASELPVQGLEWYAGFLEMQDRSQWSSIRKKVEEKGLTIPMMCVRPTSPTLTQSSARNRLRKRSSGLI